ncbi:divergent polysaccharide deacetylase family protein [Sulfitobacter aestuariivivens]|nr:divergent polysaccharide deacetylase family protein [Sulfitobacter aestuariivivens]
MARGFLSGILWGGLLGLIVVGVASALAPPPMLPVTPQVADVAPSVDKAPETVVTVLPPTQESASVTAPTEATAPVQAPASDTIVLDQEATRPPVAPETGGTEELETPTAASEESDMGVVAEAPVQPSPQSIAPLVPQAQDVPDITTAPANPPAPVDPEVADAPATTPEEVSPTPPTQTPIADAGTQAEPEDAPAAQSEVPLVAEQSAVTVAPEAPEAPAAEPLQDTQIAALSPAPDVQPLDPPSVVTPSTEQPPQPDTTAPAPVPAPVEGPATDVAIDSDGGAVRPAIGQPTVPLTERNTSTVAIRRPSSTTLGQVDDGDTAEVVVEAPEETPADPRPVARYAQAFENPEGKPLMSIVLIDDGSSPVTGTAGIAALRSFPYPLSFAVDSTLRDAADRVATYRAEGFEVLAMIDLPAGAQPADAETTLGAVLPTLPEVVGVLEGTRGGLQSSRPVADQVTSILMQSGHGLLTQDRGLNTMPKLARKEGVPAEPVFRDFDSKGQSATVIRRFLDQAAFKAGQEGAVVMLGRMRPDTISALLLWGLQDRAGKVALAPISAVLTHAE